MREDADEYFLGSIVLMQHDESLLEVVDGQQRLATVSIIICAIRNYLLQTGETQRADSIEQKYLQKVDLRTLEAKPQLKLNLSDQDFFQERILSRTPETKPLGKNAKESHKRILEALEIATRFMGNIAATAKSPVDDLLDWLDFFDRKARIIRVQVAYRSAGFYRRFRIPKHSGGYRQIDEPLPNLKDIQRWILEHILNRLPQSIYAKAYVKGKSIKDNARFHRGQEMVLKLDVKDFFPSLSTPKVRALFEANGYAHGLSYYLTRLCTLDGGLPQGAPTSPALSNLLMADVDDLIGTYCREHSIRYTRYADDFTFSGKFAAGLLISTVQRVLRSAHLKLNGDKTRLMYPHQRQIITGIVANKKLQVPRETRRLLRQCAYYVQKFGVDNHLSKLEEVRSNYLRHLRGLAHHVLFINPRDRDALAVLALFNPQDGD